MSNEKEKEKRFEYEYIIENLNTADRAHIDKPPEKIEKLSTEVTTETTKKSSEFVPQRALPMDDDSFSIRGTIQILLGRWRCVLLIGLIFSLLGIGAAFFYANNLQTHTGVSSTLIMFGFSDAELGLDPHGQSMDVNVIRSPYVIGRALDSLGLREQGFAPESVRNQLIISEVVPHNFLDRILLLRESAARNPARLIALEEEFYHPTQFTLRLYRRGALSDFTNQQMNELLNAIVNSYKEHFIETYSEFAFLDVVIAHFDPEVYDYFELLRILRGIIDNMISYTQGMRTVAPDFRSPNTEMTFGDIIANLNLIRTVDLHRIDALVHANNMSRNRTRSASIIEYDVLRMEMDLQVARANAEQALYLASEIYQHEQWVLDIWREYYHFYRATDIYESLLEDTQNFWQVANRLEVQIEYYQNRVNALRAASYPLDPADVRFVEESFPTIYQALENWENIINVSVDDFLNMELHRDAVRVLSPPGFRVHSIMDHRTTMALIVIASTGIGISLGALVALYRGKLPNRRTTY